MWLLTNVASGSVLLVISEKSKYTVGRVGADLVIPNDSSISRTHAFLHIVTTIKDANGKETTEEAERLELEDAGSKYGTFHNDDICKGQCLPKQKRVALMDGDRIRFGVLKSIWNVSSQVPIVAISVLPSELVQQLIQYIQVLGGHITSSWDKKCTHLTLGGVNINVKLLHALLAQKPIVTCDYWRDLVQAARRGRRTLPQVSSYLPTGGENFDLSYRNERQNVFHNLTFVFLNAHHYNKYSPIVEKAGGRCKHLNVGIQKSFLVRKDVVVIQYLPSAESQSSQTINDIEDYLATNSRRSIPEYEIGFAIMHCSTEKYCNPISESNRTDLLKIPESTSVQSIVSQLKGDQTEVFVPETDRKGNTITALTDNSQVASTDSGVGPNPSLTIEPQIFDVSKNYDEDASMSTLQVTESVHTKNKRKRAGGNVVSPATVGSPHMENNDDDELFNFATKRAHLEQIGKSPMECQVEDPSTSATARTKLARKSSDKALPLVINKRTSGKTRINISSFIEKSQPDTIVGENTDAANRLGTVSDAISKNVGKRARVAVIDNSDDDDLFCFGGESHSTDDTSNAKRARQIDSDEELFDFRSNGQNKQNVDAETVGAEVSNESLVPRDKYTYIVMPKPKQLPPTINVAGWLDCSLSALNIKAEEEKKEVKKDNMDTGVEKESKEIIDTIKGGFQVEVLSTKSIIHAQKKSNSMSNVDRNNSDPKKIQKNFKKFTKKFNAQNHRIVRTVSSTVCG